MGTGLNLVEPALATLEQTSPDIFLIAGRYTLLDHTALDRLFPACAARGVKVVLGGPYNSGLLAGGSTFNYETAPTELVERARAIAAVCAGHGVDLKAAALQFCAAHPVVDAIIPGARTPDEARENAAMMTVPNSRCTLGRFEARWSAAFGRAYALRGDNCGHCRLARYADAVALRIEQNARPQPSSHLLTNRLAHYRGQGTRHRRASFIGRDHQREVPVSARPERPGLELAEPLICLESTLREQTESHTLLHEGADDEVIVGLELYVQPDTIARQPYVEQPA